MDEATPGSDPSVHARERLIKRDIALHQLPHGARQMGMVVLNSCDQPHHIRQPGLRGFVERLIVDGRAQISGSHRTVLPQSESQETELLDITQHLAYVQTSRENDHFRFFAFGRIRKLLKNQLRQQAAL